MLRLIRRWGQWTVIVGLCILWYTVSSVNSVVAKTLLNQFPYPMTVTMVQLVSIAVLSEPLLRFYVKGHRPVDAGIYKKIIIPLAVGKFLASVTTHISIWRVAVSYAHTVKATMPLFTIVITRVLFGEKHSMGVYCSLIPIIFGVVLATLTELSFDMIGLLSALMATGGFSLQNIFSKRVLKRTGIHQFQLLATLGRLSLLMFLPFWFVVDARRFLAGNLELLSDPVAVFWLLGADGLLNFLHNIIAFSLLTLVTPLTYAVASATKRIAIICVSILMLRNPVSWTNFLGMVIAIGGVLLYNRTKHLEGLRKETLPKTTTAPVIKNDSNFNYLGSVDAV